MTYDQYGPEWLYAKFADSVVQFLFFILENALQNHSILFQSDMN